MKISFSASQPLFKSTLEEIMGLQNALNEKREKHMLKKINEHKPDIIVIGDAHAKKLREKLPEYEFKSYY